jgi:hypothetical protein
LGVDEGDPRPTASPDALRAAARLYNVALTFQDRSQELEASLVADFEVEAASAMASLPDVVVIDEPDLRLILSRRGAFSGQVMTEEPGARWRALVEAEDVVEYQDPSDLFAKLADAIAAAYPGVEDIALHEDAPPPRGPADQRQIDELEPIVIRTYPGRTQADAATAFADEARDFAADGYFPVGQSWADGRSGLGRVIALGFFGALVFKPNGTLTVTYELRASARRRGADGVRDYD